MTEEELNTWVKDLCKELGIPPCNVCVNVNLDAGLCIRGQDGCIVTYEAGSPGKYCISINKNILHNRELVLDALRRQILCFKWFLEESGEQPGDMGSEGTV